MSRTRITVRAGRGRNASRWVAKDVITRIKVCTRVDVGRSGKPGKYREGAPPFMYVWQETE